VERFGVADGWNASAVGSGRFEVFNRGTLAGLLRWDFRASTTSRMRSQRSPQRGRPASTGAGHQIPRRLQERPARMELRGTVAVSRFGMTSPIIRRHRDDDFRPAKPGGKRAHLGVLEPRSSTMRAGLMKDRLHDSLEQADRIFCFSANLGWDVAAALAPLGDRARIESDWSGLSGDRCRGALR